MSEDLEILICACTGDPIVFGPIVEGRRCGACPACRAAERALGKHRLAKAIAAWCEIGAKRPKPDYRKKKTRSKKKLR